MLSILSRPSSSNTEPTLTDRTSEISAADSEKPPVEPFIVPDFYHPVDFEKGIYSPQFLATFHNGNAGSTDYVTGMSVINKMVPYQRARLPLFPSASAGYTELVGKEIQSILPLGSREEEILITKRQIILCAVNYGYLTDPDIFGTQPLNFDCVNLTDMDLIGFDLTQASLEGTVFSYPARAPSDILKAPVYDFVDEELYVPVDSDKLIFSKEFYCIFKSGNENSLAQQMGLITLQQMSVYQTAQLPIYGNACAAYMKIVKDAMQQVLYSTETDDETVFVRQQIRTGIKTHWNLAHLKPIDPDKGIYPENLYLIFHKRSEDFDNIDDRIVLNSLNLQEQARLPLFDDASVEYREVVSKAIKKILASPETDPETLLTKRQIIANAGRDGAPGYRKMHKLFGNRHNFDSVNFSGLNLDGIDLSMASLANSNFSGIDMRKADLPKMGSFNACFRGSKLSIQNLYAMRTGDQYLDLADADLSGLDLSWMKIKGISLRGANCRGTKFHFTNFEQVDCSFADFTGAFLQAVNFSGAQLQRANFEGACLKNAILNGANMTGAKFFNITFEGCGLKNAITTEVQTDNLDLIVTIDDEKARLSAIEARHSHRVKELDHGGTVQSGPATPPLPFRSGHPIEQRRQPIVLRAPAIEALHSHRAIELDHSRPVQSGPATPPQPVPIEQHSQPAAPRRLSWFSKIYSSIGNFFSTLLNRFRNLFGA